MQGQSQWKGGGGGGRLEGGLAVGPEDTHSSHPPPHLSVTGSLSSQGVGDGDTTSLLLPSALLFCGKGVKSSQRLKDRTHE